MRRDVATLCAMAAGPAHGAWEVPTRLGEDLAREASEDSHSTGTPKRNTFQPQAQLSSKRYLTEAAHAFGRKFRGHVFAPGF